MQVPRHILARLALWPLTLPYRVAVRARNLAYEKGWLLTHRLPVPVISLGNLTVGGTGKTPLVALVCERLEQLGLRVAVVSRGYRRHGGNGVTVVSQGDGGGPRVEVRAAGDEPYLLAERLPGAAVVVGRDRVAAGRTAVERLGAEVLVADDAFQHRRLARDLDLLVVDATNPVGAGWLLPAGALREPLDGASRATAILISRSDRVGETTNVQTLFRRWSPGARFFRTIARPHEVILPDGSSAPPGHLHGMEVVAFCGIGRPGFFRQDLERVGAVVRDFLSFPDHHWYDQQDLQEIARRVRAAGSPLLVTTEKDFVRLTPAQRQACPLARLRIGAEVWEQRRFDRFLREALRREAAA